MNRVETEEILSHEWSSGEFRIATRLELFDFQILRLEASVLKSLRLRHIPCDYLGPQFPRLIFLHSVKYLKFLTFLPANPKRRKPTLSRGITVGCCTYCVQRLPVYRTGETTSRNSVSRRRRKCQLLCGRGFSRSLIPCRRVIVANVYSSVYTGQTYPLLMTSANTRR